MSGASPPQAIEKPRPGPVAGEAVRCTAVLAQMGLLYFLLAAFQLESEAFRLVVLTALIAFPVHHFLPHRFRMPFFVALCVTALFLVLGARHGGFLLLTALALIGMSHLPVPFPARVGLIAGVGILLMAARGNWIDTSRVPSLAVILPILGSMFMFRMIIYLYDLRHRSEPFDIWRVPAYFFLVPNVSCLLFPVVDYRTCFRTYYNDDPFRIYQVGVQWIQRGAVQLILYRFVYQYLQLDPTDIRDAADLFQHILATFLLYLQVSGLFHIIAGLLRLYGFNLPETHHLYYLASSLTDLWRRINIYWKDFTTKLFFYPLVTRLRGLGQTPAMLIATLITFLATWALHSYQWFWLRGSFLLTPQDFAFWALLGALVTLNVWYESRSAGRARSLQKRERGGRAALVLAGKTVLTFLVMALLWSMWSSESFAQWLEIMSFASRIDGRAILMLVLVVGAIGAGAVLWGRGRSTSSVPGQRLAFWPAAIRGAAATTVVGALSLGAVQSHLPEQMAGFLYSLERSNLNQRDKNIMQRGYYEDLIHVERFSRELEAIYAQRPPDYFGPWFEAMNRKTDDYLGTVLTPSMDFNYMGVQYTTNRWGMRDREYDLEKPEGTHRIAVLGASNSMGWGVNDDETCEQVLEERLNQGGSGEGRWEVLNFSVPHYGPVEKLMVLENAALRFSPDVLIYEGHRTEKQTITRHLADSLHRGHAIPYEHLEEVALRAGVDRRTSPSLAVIRLNKHASDLLSWTFRRIVGVCRERGIQPVYAYFPELLGVRHFDRQIPELLDLAREAGFVVVDLSPALEGIPDRELQLFPWDGHPNARGHRLLAEYLHRQIRPNGELGLVLPGPGGTPPSQGSPGGGSNR